MYILTKKYKYEVLQRLLKDKENFKIACSKSGLSLNQAASYLLNDKKL
jgi:hypothetical protein